jgi:hypothetical protein
VRVGSVKLGTPCYEDSFKGLNRVPTELVTFRRQKLGYVHYAKCGVSVLEAA